MSAVVIAQTDRRVTKVQGFIVLAHVVLALLYGLVIPPYEAHDETGHSAFVDHLVVTHRLPVVNKDSTTFLDQSHQPPLYYLTVAALTAWTILEWDEDTISHFHRLRREGVRIATLDLRIASIALAFDATLLTRNLTDFRKGAGTESRELAGLSARFGAVESDR